MDWIGIQENWVQSKRRFQKNWSELTDNDLDRIAGRQDRLVERIKEIYGMTQENAQRAVDEFAGAIQPDEPAGNSRKAALLFNENIRGIKAVSADGRIVGEVGDLLVNSGTWLVESVQIKLDKNVADELGIPRGRFHAGLVNLPVRMIQSVGDNMVLSVSAEGLRPTLSARKDAA